MVFLSMSFRTGVFSLRPVFGEPFANPSTLPWILPLLTISQSNGQTERVNQELEVFLRTLVSAHYDVWASLLPWAEFSHNNHVNISSQKTPFITVYGRHPQLPLPMTCSSDIPALATVQESFNSMWADVHDSLQKAANKFKSFADCRRRKPPSLQPGDKVWLSTRNIKLRVPSLKFAPRFIGPYTITSKLNPVCFKLQIPKSLSPQ